MGQLVFLYQGISVLVSVKNQIKGRVLLLKLGLEHFRAVIFKIAVRLLDRQSII